MNFPIFVGSHKRFEKVEPVCEYAVRRHTEADVQVIFLRPDRFGYPDTGCTGFTNMRYAIPQLTDRPYAIYIDVDMLLLADVAELEQYAVAGKWTCLEDGANEVMVVDCSVSIPDNVVRTHNKHALHNRIPWAPRIPIQWNCEDPERLSADMKLIHFTNLKTQPWFFESNRSDAARLWLQYEAECVN